MLRKRWRVEEWRERELPDGRFVGDGEVVTDFWTQRRARRFLERARRERPGVVWLKRWGGKWVPSWEPIDPPSHALYQHLHLGGS